MLCHSNKIKGKAVETVQAKATVIGSTPFPNSLQTFEARFSLYHRKKREAEAVAEGDSDSADAEAEAESEAEAEAEAEGDNDIKEVARR